MSVFEGVVGRVMGLFVPPVVSEMRLRRCEECKFGAVFKLVLEIYMHQRFSQKSFGSLWS